MDSRKTEEVEMDQHLDVQMQNVESHIVQREYLLSKIQRFTLLSNVFLSVALEDIAACQHVLRIILHKSELVVVRVKSQYRISKLTSHDAILDLFAEDSEGNLYNIEIQREDTVDHAKRMRFYCAMVDSESLFKGASYSELPRVTAVYISESDIWHGGRTVYEVKNSLEAVGMYGYKRPYQEERRIVYVNAEVDDGSEIAKLMSYFKRSDPYDMSQGALSKRVHYLKCEEGGLDYMCKVSEELFNDGKAAGLLEGQRQGLLEGKQEVALRLFGKGMTDEQTAELVDCSLPVVREWRKNYKK